ncbi:hypothetical protein GCM10011511_11660 [Puia dinghuensis]|uniref:Uncharacterized protein n=2 Tax=Puia dinghuensis TaxID=1792502 RepID=A0A8J2XRR1_9BACT|nr:hypothetical protein GCM10011511_11660 [Puia dinghuensis]
MELVGKLGRLGYLGGTKVIDHWKADNIPKETALAVLREATGLPDNQIIEKIELPPEPQYGLLYFGAPLY